MVHRPMCGVVAIGALAVLVLTLSPSSVPSQVKTIYIVPGAHFDVGFDAPPAVVRERRIEAYLVTYSYAGHRHRIRTAQRPGNHIRVPERDGGRWH